MESSSLVEFLILYKGRSIRVQEKNVIDFKPTLDTAGVLESRSLHFFVPFPGYYGVKVCVKAVKTSALVWVPLI